MAEKPPIPFDCEGNSDAARPPLLREVADQLEEVYSDRLDILSAAQRALAAATAERYRQIALAHADATAARAARDAAILEDRAVTDVASLAEGRIPMRKLMSTDLAEREFRAEIAVLLRITESAAAYLISDALLIASEPHLEDRVRLERGTPRRRDHGVDIPDRTQDPHLPRRSLQQSRLISLPTGMAGPPLRDTSEPARMAHTRWRSHSITGTGIHPLARSRSSEVETALVTPYCGRR